MEKVRDALRREPTAATRKTAARFMQRNWENVLEGISDGIIVADKQFSVVFLNHAAQQLIGLSTTALLGQPMDQAFLDNPWLAQLVKDVSRGGVSRCLGALDLLGRAGQRYHVSPCASSFFDSAGGVAGIVVRLNDMGHLRKLEETDPSGLQSTSLQTMAAGLAHEIRNPLGGIKGAAQLLKEKLAPDPDMSEYPTLIVREVERVTSLLDRLLLPASYRPAARTRVNVHRILDRVLRFEAGGPGTRLSIRRRFDPSLPEVIGDDDQLTQVVLNLVRNAIEAIAGEGLLTVTTLMETDFKIREPSGETDRFLSFEIADSGPGIRADCLPQVFTPFFTTKGSGSGLGLTICQRIVAEHGGSIRIETSSGGGTRVRVTLPVAP